MIDIRQLRESQGDYLSKFDPREKPGYPSEKKIPVVLILKRKAIRVYPDHQKVALYYAQALDKYVTIPFGNDGDMGIATVKEETLNELTGYREKPAGWKEGDKLPVTKPDLLHNVYKKRALDSQPDENDDVETRYKKRIMAAKAEKSLKRIGKSQGAAAKSWAKIDTEKAAVAQAKEKEAAANKPSLLKGLSGDVVHDAGYATGFLAGKILKGVFSKNSRAAASDAFKKSIAARKAGPIFEEDIKEGVMDAIDSVIGYSRHKADLEKKSKETIGQNLVDFAKDAPKAALAATPAGRLGGAVAAAGMSRMGGRIAAKQAAKRIAANKAAKQAANKGAGRFATGAGVGSTATNAVDNLISPTRGSSNPHPEKDIPQAREYAFKMQPKTSTPGRATAQGNFTSPSQEIAYRNRLVKEVNLSEISDKLRMRYKEKAMKDMEVRQEIDTDASRDMERYMSPESKRNRKKFANRYNAVYPIKKAKGIKEDVLEKLRNLPKGENTLVINEEQIVINNKLARKMIKVYEQLDNVNQQKFERMLTESTDSFKKVVKFVLKY